MQYEIDSLSDRVLRTLKLSQKYDESLGLPLLAEGERVDNLWKSLEIALQDATKSQLVLVFVNQRKSDTEEIQKSNHETLDFFELKKADLFNFSSLGRHGVLVVNGTLEDTLMEVGEGVGRARKVLADLAYGLWKKGDLTSELHRQTDGDAKVSRDYFLTTLDQKSVAGTYAYFHSQGELTDEEFSQLQHYEKWLESYTRGLALAGSRYTFWPLGSTLIFKLSAYEKVRGIPNVRAGEDFHFLSKLSKIGNIEQLKSLPIELRGRHSTRVPFGTGRALLKMKSGEKTYELFSQSIFEDLRVLLKKIDVLAEGPNLDVFYSSLNLRDRSFFEEFKNAFQKILIQRNSCEQKKKQLHECFDALKTMRWVNLNLQEQNELQILTHNKKK